MPNARGHSQHYERHIHTGIHRDEPPGVCTRSLQRPLHSVMDSPQRDSPLGVVGVQHYSGQRHHQCDPARLSGWPAGRRSLASASSPFCLRPHPLRCHTYTELEVLRANIEGSRGQRRLQQVDRQAGRRVWTGRRANSWAVQRGALQPSPPKPRPKQAGDAPGLRVRRGPLGLQ